MDQYNNEHNHTETFLKGAVLLGAAGVVVKILGAFFRIPLGNILGPEAMSYYTSAYPIYNFFIVLATTGLPTALAKIISEQRAMNQEDQIDQTFRVGMILMGSIGIVGALFMFFGAELIVGFIKNEGALYSFKALGPAIFIVSLMSVFRGYFQGHQDLKPFAVSQLVEQLGRVVVGLGLATALLSVGLRESAAGATFGATAGALAGLSYILYRFVRQRKGKKENILQKSLQSSKKVLKKIVVIAVPITMGAAVMPLMNSIDVLIVFNRLHDIGLGEQANDLFGMLSGYAATLVNLPQVVTAAIQISIVPAIAGLYVRESVKDLRITIESGVRMALIVGLPAAAGLIVLSRPIMELLYPRQIMYAQTTGSILSILGFTVIFLGLFQVTTGILQGLGLQNRPAMNLAVGAAVKVVLTYTLVGIPSINIYGAAFSTVVAYAVATTLNIVTLKKRANVVFKFKRVLMKPLFSTLIMSGAALGIQTGLQMFSSSRLITVAAIVVGILAYGIMLFLTRTFDDNDFALIPGGSKLKKINDRYFARN